MPPETLLLAQLCENNRHWSGTVVCLTVWNTSDAVANRSTLVPLYTPGAVQHSSDVQCERGIRVTEADLESWKGRPVLASQPGSY